MVKVRYALALAVMLGAARARAQDAGAPEQRTPDTAASAADASATDTSATLEARTLFEEGVRMSRQERWLEALDLFRRSRAVVARPSTIFNLAIALDRLGRARESIAAIDEYLAISDPALDRDDRREAMRLRVDAEARLAHLTVVVGAPSPSLQLDGAPIDPGAEVLVDPGDHVLLAGAPGHVGTRIALSLAPGAHLERRIDLVTDGATRTRTPSDAPPSASGGSLLEDPVFWAITGGVVAVGLAVAIGAAVATSQSPSPYAGTTGLTFDVP
jgi:hypothetical protein